MLLMLLLPLGLEPLGNAFALEPFYVGVPSFAERLHQPGPWLPKLADSFFFFL